LGQMPGGGCRLKLEKQLNRAGRRAVWTDRRWAAMLAIKGRHKPQVFKLSVQVRRKA
jgi:hypothetical protein